MTQERIQGFIKKNILISESKIYEFVSWFYEVTFLKIK